MSTRPLSQIRAVFVFLTLVASIVVAMMAGVFANAVAAVVRRRRRPSLVGPQERIWSLPPWLQA